jgi:riboflavin kinase
MRTIKGTVVRGIGEGSYYIKRYSTRIEEAIGIAPFYGTLNLKTDEIGPIASNLHIDGFENDERSYGGLSLRSCRVRGLRCWAVFPERGHHKDVLELISPLDLRKTLNLEDGDELEVEFPDVKEKRGGRIRGR